jgi:hypothetical protein
VIGGQDLNIPAVVQRFEVAGGSHAVAVSTRRGRRHDGQAAVAETGF